MNTSPPHSYPFRPNSSGPSEPFPDLVNPAPLSADHLKSCRLTSSREEMIALLPKGGRIAEIGVHTARFSQILYDVLQPEELILIDLEDRIQGGILQRPGVRFLQGDSSVILSGRFQDGYFDLIYIDGDHSLGGVWKDCAAARTKIKPQGILAFDDYTLFSHLENFIPYGIVQCVNHLCVTDGWEIIFFSFRCDYAGYNNVAIRRIQHAT